MSKLLKDASGIYNLDHVGSLQPIPIKGDKADQNKITAVYTAIAMNGGQTHHTTIPWASAAAIAEAYWNENQPAKAAAPKAAPPVAQTDAEKLAAAQAEFG